jgi:hypothetical protein
VDLSFTTNPAGKEQKQENENIKTNYRAVDMQDKAHKT